MQTIRAVLSASVCIAVLGLCATAFGDLREAKKNWPKMPAGQKIAVLRELGKSPSAALLGQIRIWLKDGDADVRVQLVDVAVKHAQEKRLVRKAVETVEHGIDRHLKVRRERQDREFREVCKKHGTKLPPDDQIAAGAAWKDPWNEANRKLPRDTQVERAHALALIALLADGDKSGARLFGPALVRMIEQHHDPKVVIAAITAAGRLGEWRALPAMADIWRPLEQGRMVGGSHVIGEKKWRTMRLRWDVHKDRLWWSRPEYLLNAARPIRAAAKAITGRDFATAADLDRWILAQESALKKHGVKLGRDFRRRAATSR